MSGSSTCVNAAKYAEIIDWLMIWCRSRGMACGSVKKSSIILAICIQSRTIDNRGSRVFKASTKEEKDTCMRLLRLRWLIGSPAATPKCSGRMMVGTNMFSITTWQSSCHSTLEGVRVDGGEVGAVAKGGS